MHAGLNHLRGATRILDTSLGLKAGEEVLVVLDETTTDLAEYFANAAIDIDVRVAFLLHPITAQQSTRSPSELPSTLAAAIREPHGVLICVNGSSECLAFRTGVFQLARKNGVKTGHLPGMTRDVLPFADTDYKACSRLCSQLASILGRGDTAEIVTYDSAGREYHLTLSLQGWEVPPLIFDSVIQNSTWENVPAGETFVCPKEGSADGQVYIDGSVPGCVIEPGEGILLTFRDGRFVFEELSGNSGGARAVLEHERNFAMGKKDTEWNQLAELGIGVNPAVDRLLGIALSDEKKLGTIHVAIGNNRFFGGDIDSEIHCDMVICEPDLLVDNEILIERGVLRPEQWESRSVALPSQISSVSRTGDFRVGEGGDLQREWQIATGKTCCVSVGAKSDGAPLLDILNVIPPTGKTAMAELLTQLEYPEEKVVSLLQLLAQFGIVEAN